MFFGMLFDLDHCRGPSLTDAGLAFVEFRRAAATRCSARRQGHSLARTACGPLAYIFTHLKFDLKATTHAELYLSWP
ncbi:hypothetical protein, partial [Burkholderia sp. SCN-KJ]|uniref:hypothetical protein n=1 Tax=Burkholderia sp. SCN-KJ TaxID=2969248 RepID=UPI0021504680